MSGSRVPPTRRCRHLQFCRGGHLSGFIRKLFTNLPSHLAPLCFLGLRGYYGRFNCSSILTDLLSYVHVIVTVMSAIYSTSYPNLLTSTFFV